MIFSLKSLKTVTFLLWRVSTVAIFLKRSDRVFFFHGMQKQAAAQADANARRQLDAAASRQEEEDARARAAAEQEGRRLIEEYEAAVCSALTSHSYTAAKEETHAYHFPSQKKDAAQAEERRHQEEAELRRKQEVCVLRGSLFCVIALASATFRGIVCGVGGDLFLHSQAALKETEAALRADHASQKRAKEAENQEVLAGARARLADAVERERAHSKVTRMNLYMCLCA